MKLIHTPRHRSRSGFTLVELLVSTAVAMLLLYGAIYSSLESFAVASAGDTRIHTQVHARRVMERLIKDCRYATEITVTGDEASDWEIDLTTGVDDEVWTWTWDASTETLSLSDGSSTEAVVTGLTGFSVDAQLNGESNIDRVTLLWTVREDAGGTGGAAVDATITIPGSTWVRANTL